MKEDSSLSGEGVRIRLARVPGRALERHLSLEQPLSLGGEILLAALEALGMAPVAITVLIDTVLATESSSEGAMLGSSLLLSFLVGDEDATGGDGEEREVWGKISGVKGDDGRSGGGSDINVVNISKAEVTLSKVFLLEESSTVESLSQATSATVLTPAVVIRESSPNNNSLGVESPAEKNSSAGRIFVVAISVSGRKVIVTSSL